MFQFLHVNLGFIGVFENVPVLDSWLDPAAFFIILGEGVSNWVPLLLQLSRKRGGLQLN